jgi:hypothetical protein
MSDTTLLDALLPHFEDHQTLVDSDSGYLSLKDRIRVIEKALNNITIVQGDASSKDDAALDDGLSKVLLHIFDCAMATDTSAESSESVRNTLLLVAGVSSKHLSVASALLDRASQFSQVLLEKVRTTACTFIGFLADFLRDQSSVEDIMDRASQILLPRFTDKLQSVRCAAIQAAPHFFSTHIDDPDLRQALCWSLQHDPSVTNRLAALNALPWNGQTMDAILARVRDDKAKIRVQTWKYLQDHLNPNDLPAIDLADLVNSGLSGR